jgi:hypothetical protein
MSLEILAKGVHFLVDLNNSSLHQCQSVMHLKTFRKLQPLTEAARVANFYLDPERGRSESNGTFVMDDLLQKRFLTNYEMLVIITRFTTWINLS